MRFQNARGRDRDAVLTDPTSNAAQWRFIPVADETRCTHEATICDDCVMDWSDWEIEVQEVNVPWIGVEYTAPDAEHAAVCPAPIRRVASRRTAVMTAKRMVPWTDADETTLLHMHHDGFDFTEIAEAMGRSYRAVEQRYYLIVGRRGGRTEAT